MADVLMICVREDVARAEALAEMFDVAGFSVGDATSSSDDSAVSVLVWSEAASSSLTFHRAATRAISAGRFVVARLEDAPPPPEAVGLAQIIDLADWDDDPDALALEPLSLAVERLVLCPAEPPPEQPQVYAVS